MSGALPETERERQLRQLAGRLLHWPDPEGPVTADLLPVGYADDLPAEIVDRTELRVRYHPEGARETITNMGRGMPQEEPVIPHLKPPPGVKFQPEGIGGGGGRWKSDARAQTEMAPMELEAFFARQLEAAGWGRMTGSADNTFAWSSWLIPDSGEWRGVLLVLAAFPGVRQLSVQAERILPGGHRGEGGYAVSGLIS